MTVDLESPKSEIGQPFCRIISNFDIGVSSKYENAVVVVFLVCSNYQMIRQRKTSAH